MAHSTSAIIVGAGESKFLNVPLIKKEVNTLREAGVSDISVILGHEEETMKRKLVHHKLTFLTNKQYENSQMLDSIKLGLESVKPKCKKIILIPSDTPSFSLKTVEKLLAAEGDVIIPSYNGRRGHPILIKKSIIDKIIAYEEDGGLRGAIEKNGFQIEEIQVDDEGILMDVETHAEYRHILDFEKERLEGVPITVDTEVTLIREKPFCHMTLVKFLQIIDREGSMNKACKSIGMSYSKAWKMVNDGEEQLNFSLIERQVGGSKGGKSSLTNRGRKLIDAFIEMEENISNAAEMELKKFIDKL